MSKLEIEEHVLSYISSMSLNTGGHGKWDGLWPSSDDLLTTKE